MPNSTGTRRRHAAHAAGDRRQLLDQDLRDLEEAERDDREIEAAQAQGGKAEREAEELPAISAAERQRHPEAQADLGHQVGRLRRRRSP